MYDMYIVFQKRIRHLPQRVCDLSNVWPLFCMNFLCIVVTPFILTVCNFYLVFFIRLNLFCLCLFLFFYKTKFVLFMSFPNYVWLVFK